MADLRVHGTVGKATVRMMTDAILRSAGADADPKVVVLLDSHVGVLQALATSGSSVTIVANGDSVPASQLPASAVTFGLGSASTLWASELEATLAGTEFTLNAGGDRHRVA